MRTIAGQPPVWGQWCRVTDDREPLRGISPFRSRNWFTDHPNDGIGEQEGRAVGGRRNIDWRDGVPPAFYVGGGYCGSARAYREGAVVGRDPIFWTNLVGQAPCCSTYVPDEDIDGVLLPIGLGVVALAVPPTAYQVALPIGLGLVAQVVQPSPYQVALPIGLGLVAQVIPPSAYQALTPIGVGIVAQLLTIDIELPIGVGMLVTLPGLEAAEVETPIGVGMVAQVVTPTPYPALLPIGVGIVAQLLTIDIELPIGVGLVAEAMDLGGIFAVVVNLPIGVDLAADLVEPIEIELPIGIDFYEENIYMTGAGDPPPPPPPPPP